MINPRRKTDFVWWRRLLAGAVFLFPYALSSVDFRAAISAGISVSAHKASPAYAAFEDLNQNFKSDVREIPDNGIRLAAGEPIDMRVIEATPRQRVLAMKGMTIRAPAEHRAIAQPLVIAAASGAAHAPANTEPRFNDVKAAALVARAKLTDTRGELLPIQERARNLIAQYKEENWTLPNPADAAKDLIERERAADGALIMRSGTGTPIYIKKPDASPSAASPAAAEPAPREEEKEDDQLVAGLNPVGYDASNIRPLWLNGQIEMTGGLAFVGPETHLEVKRILNGQVQERGRIWVTEGRFEIQVKRPTGYLVAELRTRDGRTLGRGEMNLVHLATIPLKGARVDDIRLALRPTAEGAAFRTISGYSHGQQQIPVADARVEIQSYTEPQKVNDEGMIEEASLSKDSSFVARATAPKHWASVVVGQANHPQDIRVFSNSLVEALINLQLESTDRKEAFKASVVWGQISKDGAPVEGAEVEMAGNYAPIYFNEMHLPDKSMKKTGKNGLFAFLSVKQGVQALRVKNGKRMYPAQVFPTEDKHVSYVELQLRDKVISQFRVFDVFDFTKPINAHIRMVGTDEMLPVAGQQMVEYAMAADPFMVEAEAGPEYEISRATLTGSPHLVQVPLIKRDWLYKMYTEQGIVNIPGRGMVAGFIDDQDFEIEMTGYAPGEKMQIVYFDEAGRATTSRTGAAGGGFIIFNAPPGLQTVYIHPTQSRETVAQVVVAEPRYVHVLTWAQKNQHKQK